MIMIVIIIILYIYSTSKQYLLTNKTSCANCIRLFRNHLVLSTITYCYQIFSLKEFPKIYLSIKMLVVILISTNISLIYIV